MVTRQAAIDRATAYFDGGAFKRDLARRVAIPTESQNPERAPDLARYVETEIRPALEGMGFSCRILEQDGARGPFLYGERLENDGGPTVLGYGHGDVIRGFEGAWREGRSPWTLAEADGRWYGRGVSDNKGQHSINLAALDAVLAVRNGRLGFDAKFLIEMGEEVGSPGLWDLCAGHRDLFRSDALIASDGPRLSLERPTIFLGARGAYPIDLWVEARPGNHHSGNFGGLLANPGIELAHAIAAIVGPTGQIRIPDWMPTEVPPGIRRALEDVQVETEPGGPEIDPWWGEPGLTQAEKVFAWSSFEILAFACGNPEAPVNAIPGRASARGQLRFVVGVDPDAVIPALRRHLDAQGFSRVQVAKADDEVFAATRSDLDGAWVQWAADSIQRTTDKVPAILPNLGGSLPNDVFAELLGLPTIWVPHSYSGSSQHAPNEHLPLSAAREGLAIMAGLYWDLGDEGTRPVHGGPGAHPV
jgi:acetylornithine deacetylase/succinyl-diaminopimelate desuccinylase-like protein